MAKNYAWSYSALDMYKQCARKYYHIKVLKDIPYVQNDSAKYGEAMHKAVELYGKNRTPLPQEFAFVKPTVDQMLAITGSKYWEYKIALDERLNPCDYWDKATWWRGQLDLLILNGSLAYVVDWKSGKSKNADIAQCELMALGIFRQYPSVQKVKAGLAFLTENKFVPAAYTADRQDYYWKSWLNDLQRLEASYANNVWNPSPSALCGWCPVKTCAHWYDRSTRGR